MIVTAPKMSFENRLSKRGDVGQTNFSGNRVGL